MNEINFAHWLQGFFELTNISKLDTKQVEIIKEHLALVFVNKTNDLSVREKTAKRPNDEKIRALYCQLAILPETDPGGKEFTTKTSELKELQAKEAKTMVAKIKEELPIDLDNSVIDSAAEVIAKYEKRPLPSLDTEIHYDNFMDWDGLVIGVNELSFNARLTDQSGLVEELITIGKDEVSEEDLSLLNKGAVFSLIVSREMVGDRVFRGSTIKFRPQHFWTKEDTELMELEAKKYDPLFDLPNTVS